MQRYELNVAGLKRYLNFVDISDELAFASFVVISDTEMIEKCAPLLAEKLKGCDAVVTAEAKGIALAYKISEILGLKEFIVARKSEKTYMHDTIEVSVQSITTANRQVLLLDGEDSKKIEGRNVCLIDDVVSTGESLNALERLVKAAGANVVKKACILAEGDAAKRDDIIFLERLPLFKKADGEYEEILYLNICVATNTPAEASSLLPMKEKPYWPTSSWDAVRTQETGSSR